MRFSRQRGLRDSGDRVFVDGLHVLISCASHTEFVGAGDVVLEFAPFHQKYGDSWRFLEALLEVLRPIWRHSWLLLSSVIVNSSMVTQFEGCKPMVVTGTFQTAGLITQD